MLQDKRHLLPEVVSSVFVARGMIAVPDARFHYHMNVFKDFASKFVLLVPGPPLFADMCEFWKKVWNAVGKPESEATRASNVPYEIPDLDDETPAGLPCRNVRTEVPTSWNRSSLNQNNSKRTLRMSERRPAEDGVSLTKAEKLLEALTRGASKRRRFG
eukprot:g35422.t1